MSADQLNRVILVVDDDARARIILREALEQADFVVEEAEDGSQAMDCIQRRMPGLVLLDVVMPVMDGFETCLAIRAMPDGENLPIVLMTGLDDSDSINRAFEIGATSFVTKPINYLLLTYRLKYLLRSAATARDLRESQVRLAKAQQQAKLGHWEWDARKRVVRCSPTLAEMIGRPDAVDGLRFREVLRLVDPRDRQRVRNIVLKALRSKRGYWTDHRVVLPDGSERVIFQEAEVVVDGDGRIVHLGGIAQDITERRRSEEKIRYLAYFDTVTGLPNRALLKQIFSNTLATSKRYNRSFALLFVDLDHFKRINDTLGHDTGDELLRQVAIRLRTCLRSSDRMGRSAPDDDGLPSGVFGGDAVTRLGGDEFLILLTEIRTPENAATVARRVLDVLTAPITIGDTEVVVSASIGIAVYPLDGADFETLLKKADTAMYHAKDTGRNCAKYFAGRLNQQTMIRFNLETDLRRAIQEQEFELFYQPKIDLKSNRAVGVEALIRWRHPEKGLVLPGEFVPVAEELGLIVPIGDWVLNEAFAQAAVWKHKNFGDLEVSVNISALQLTRSSLMERLPGLLKEYKLEASKISIEITETALFEDKEKCIIEIEEIGKTGIGVAIDDFGVGYSSFNYLKTLPVSALKIDRSFIADLGSDPNNSAIVRAIIGLAHNLKLTAIAEGVETQQQLELLRFSGCDLVQGFLYSRPLPADDIERWILQHNTTPLHSPHESDEAQLLLAE
jgi:PAS domain S-box-containing protein